MNIWENAVITTKGRALLAKLIAGNTLAITRAVVGAGTVTPGLLLEQTNVTDAKQALSFTGIAYPEAGKCALSCNLRNDGVETGYTAMQVGVFATDPDDGEILFFITQAASGKGTEIPSKSEMGNFSAEWTFHFQYGQADEVNVTVDPAAAVTQAKMEAYVEEYIAEHVIPALNELNKLDPAKLTAPVPIEKGGTGAASAADARASLGVPSNTDLNKAYNKVISMGEQLVVNGNGYMGDNTNFSKLTFDGTQANNSPGSFTSPRGVRNDCACDGFIPIDPTKDYILSMDAKTLNAQLLAFSFVQYYDVDGNVNSRTYSTFLEGSTTKLTQDLKPGDTVMHVEDVSGWKYENTYDTAIFWNYKNSFGYAYPTETYSRNYVMLPVSGSAPVDGTFDTENNTVTLRTAYTGATIPAGTAVSQGGTRWGEEYVALRGNTPPTEWKNYSGKILKTAIVPYSAFGKVGWYWNYSSHDDQMWVTNIKLESVKGSDPTSIDPAILSGAVPIAKGGTGATDAATARANLGAVSLTGADSISGEKRFKDHLALDGKIFNFISAGGTTGGYAGVHAGGIDFYRSGKQFSINYQGGSFYKKGYTSTLPNRTGTLALMDIKKVTLSTSGWALGSDERYYQTVTVEGVTADDAQAIMVDVDLSTTDADAKIAYLEAWGIVSANEVTQGSGSLTFYAWEIPASNIPVNVGVM